MENFKIDLADENMTSKDILNKYIFTGEPYIFNTNIGLYSKLKSQLSTHFSVEVTKIFMVGSAKLGFSIAREKLWKIFDDDSDIDMVIISGELFDSFWHDLSGLSNIRYASTEQDEKKYNSFLKYFFRGWIRTDFLPLSHPKTQEWLDYFRDISYKEFGPYKITGAIFKNEFFFRKYHEKNIDLIRKGENNG